MCSKGVWQLEELTLRYCKHSGASRGLREFVRDDLLSFAKANPQLKIATRAFPNHRPLLLGRYVSGVERVVNVARMSKSEVGEHVQAMRDHSGRPAPRKVGVVKTDTPSVQGPWHPGLSYDDFGVRA